MIEERLLSEPTSGFVETPDVRLHYVDWGGAAGRPVLLLVHATGFHARLWDPYIAALRDRMRVIALDQRGHGDSGPARNGYDWQYPTEDVFALITALGIEGCHAVGHSAGGTAVATCAALHPGSIARLTLIDPVLRDDRGMGFPPDGANPMAERTRRRRALWDSPAELEEAMRGRGAFARWQPEFLSAYAQHALRRREDGAHELKCSPETEARVYEGAIRYDPWPALARLTAPSTLLRATLVESGRVPLPAGSATRLPNCRDFPVSATHFIPMEAPEAVITALTGG